METLRFSREFSCRRVAWDFCILGGVIPKQIIVLFFFVVCELALGKSCTWAHDVRLHVARTNDPKSAQEDRQGA